MRETKKRFDKTELWLGEIKRSVEEIRETIYGEPVDFIYETLSSHMEKIKKSIINRLSVAEEKIIDLEKELKQSICKHTNQEKKCKDCGKEL